MKTTVSTDTAFARSRRLWYHTCMATNEGKTNRRSELRQEDGLQIAQRGAVYVVRTLLFIIMGCILCIVAFLTAERVSNLYILISEGMALRADCILMDGARNDLEEYFTLTYLGADPALSADTYDHYTVTGYNYDFNVESISVLPWSVTATAMATERVSVKGTINEDQLSDGESAAAYPIPPWTPVRYRIDLINNESRWFISGVTVIEENPKQKAEGTPDPNQSPIPAATPTPAPTDPPPSTLPVSS